MDQDPKQVQRYVCWNDYCSKSFYTFHDPTFITNCPYCNAPFTKLEKRTDETYYLYAEGSTDETK